MSSVLARKRKQSELEFYKNATEIRAIFTRYLMNEKKVPKRWRPVFTFSGIEYTRKLFDSIIAANTIYPQTEEDVVQRRQYHNEAIIACEQMLQHMQWMVDTLDGVKVSDFVILGEMLLKEISLLKAWRKTNKILAVKSAHDDTK